MSQPDTHDPYVLFTVAAAYLDDVDISAPGEPSDTTS